MAASKTPAGKRKGTGNSQKKNPGCGIILIFIILIIILFFWPFISYTSMQWTGNIQNQIVPSSDNTQNEIPVSQSTEALPAFEGGNLQNRNTTTVYNTEYLRWAGKLKPGASAVWGKITIEGSELPVDGGNSPLAPSRIYGNLRELNGTGVNLMVFNEANYNAWINGGTKVSALIYNKNITDYDYSFGIDAGAYYIVVQNSSKDKEAYIGFTGVHVYQRILGSGESPYYNPDPPRCFWDYKKEKITIFQYIMKLIKPAYNVPVTPPSIL